MNAARNAPVHDRDDRLLDRQRLQRKLDYAQVEVGVLKYVTGLKKQGPGTDDGQTDPPRACWFPGAIQLEEEIMDGRHGHLAVPERSRQASSL
jgi:hypothetical protein